MKKLLLILITISLISNISFSQSKQNVNVNTEVKVEKKTSRYGTINMKYIGDGIFSITKQGNTMNTKRGLEKKAMKEIEQYARNLKAKYEIILIEKGVDEIYAVRPVVKITFKMLNIDGQVLLEKDEVKSKILELKEYLNLGIITQKEYDEKAAPLKKMLLEKY